MPVSHEERKQMKKTVYDNVVNHILEIKKAVKVNDLFDDFHGDVFTNIPYFVRSFVLLAEKDSRIHIKSAQRAGTWAAPVDIDFPELTNKVTKTKKKKKLTETIHLQENSKQKESVDSVKKDSSEPLEAEKESCFVDMSTDHEESVVKPSSNELFGDKEPDEPDDWEEDRFFTDADGREFEGKMSDINPDDSEDWSKINKRLLTSAGYSDVIELYRFDDDHTHEYVAITSEDKVFHFVEMD